MKLISRLSASPFPLMTDQALFFWWMVLRQGMRSGIMARCALFFHFFPVLPFCEQIKKRTVPFVRRDIPGLFPADVDQNKDSEDRPDDSDERPVAYFRYHGSLCQETKWEGL